MTSCTQIRLPYWTHLDNRVHHIWNITLLSAHCTDEPDTCQQITPKIKESGSATDHLCHYFLQRNLPGFGRTNSQVWIS